MRFNRSDAFLGLWSMYYLQGILYPEGIINKLLLLVLLIIQIKPLLRAFSQDMNKPIIASTCMLLLMYVIYGGSIILFGDGITWTPDAYYLKSSLLSLLPILFFYYETKQGHISETRIMIYTLIVIAVSIAKFNFIGSELAAKIGNEEVTNNMGYMFVAIIPMLFFFHRRLLLQYLLLAVVVVYVILGMKRGAILIGSICVLIFLYAILRNVKRRQKIIVLLLITSIIIITVVSVRYMMTSSEYFLERIEQTVSGDTSSRDEIYFELWNHIREEGEVLPFIFGRGANSTIHIAGDYAHQDWLETFCNNGLLGVLLLMCFFWSFAATVTRSKKYFKPYMYYSFVVLFFLTFTKTLFSMSIQNLDMYQGLLIGYLTYLSTHEGRRLLN